MFALYEITDKGSSWIGPLMVAFIANSLSIRWGMIYVALFFLIPLPILIYGVSLKDGMKQAGRWKEEEEDKEKNQNDENEDENRNDDDKLSIEMPETKKQEKYVAVTSPSDSIAD